MKNKFKLIFLIVILTGCVSSTIAYDHQKTNNNNNSNITIKSSSPDTPFIYGCKQKPNGLDPHYVLDQESYKVLDQVCEGLYAYNLSDPELAIIPNLATSHGTWSTDYLNYTVPLRIGVTFHDGTSFNASAVKFTFDRLAYFMNYSVPVGQTILTPLYELSVNKPIINRTEIIDTYSIKFVLNAPYAPFQALLCFSGSYILSPASTPATDYIDLNTGNLIGTGPFVYDGYTPNVEVSFYAYDDYWREKADIEEMTFSIITNPYDRIAALIDGDAHFIDEPIPSTLDVLKLLSEVTVLESGTTSSIVNFLGMNTRQINVLWRDAISHAIDYDYLINEVYEGNAVRLRSPIPKGIRYANWTFNVPILNLTRARMLVQLMGYGIGFNLYDDTEWVNQATNAPFATFNYTYNFGDTIREDILALLQDNLAKIGIRVTAAGTTLTQFLYLLYEIGGVYYRNKLQLFWFNHLPYYNDPYYFLNELFTNRSLANNYVQYNGGRGRGGPFQPYGPFPYDPTEDVQLLMEAALIEMDSIAREAIYDEIQRLLIERDFPWAWGVVEKLYYAHHVNLTGFQQNSLKKMYFYSCEWNPEITYQLDITHPSDITYFEGSTGHTITWIVTTNLELNTSYFIFKDLEQVDSGSWTSGTPIVINVDALAAGNYIFRIEAHNDVKLIEDTVIVIVKVKTEEPIIPGFPVWFIIIISLNLLFYLSKRARKKII
ncbi:MAG: ABC transporter substrate-binding protein [Promethearchaeota archaeon]